MIPTSQADSVFIPPIKILLVEDNVLTQEFTVELLAKTGCIITVVNNGIEALQRLIQTAFDVILMDCYLPEWNGYTTTLKIREYEKAHDLPRVLIVGLSGNTVETERMRCLQAGMDDYLFKPIQLEQLQTILQTLLGRTFELNNVIPALEKNEYKQSPDIESEQHLLDNSRDELNNPRFNWLIDLYINEIPRYLADLQLAYTQKNVDNFYMAAHRLKGSSLSIGAQQIANICRILEKMSPQTDYSSIGLQLLHLQTVSEQTKQALLERKQRLSSTA